MNLISAKALSELNLHGVKIDWTKEDKSVNEVRLHDGNGGRIVIRVGDYGSTLKVMISQPYEDAERFLLSGKFLDLADVREYFEDKYAAQAKLDEYAEKVRGDHGLTIAKVTVKIDDAGAVVETAAAKADEDEIAF